MNMKSTIAAAALALALPVAGNAATVAFDGANDNITGTLVAGSHLTYDFVLDKEYIVYLSLGVTGTLANVSAVTYGFAAGDLTYTSRTANGPASVASTTYSFTTSSDFTFGFFGAGTTAGVGTTLTYYFEAVPTVPVPAAGVLLLTALGGLGVAARRKKA